ncbi:hypothetical protein [Couchioplanes caeruleus]|uniref:Uncharacterized protein n=1 Tax=Couchioplanes caeruleus TaxID=56438 RepID=A0A3N1GUT8_9ACTN|nr:hypothetical protein [Couchioplanes caeruleus]ROP34030.1 hypothetical protein EDD30_7095 [Couchioplanes caeruleus]
MDETTNDPRFASASRGGDPTVICASFKGVIRGEPKRVGAKPDGVSCVASGITLR